MSVRFAFAPHWLFTGQLASARDNCIHLPQSIVDPESSADGDINSFPFQATCRLGGANYSLGARLPLRLYSSGTSRWPGGQSMERLLVILPLNRV